MLPPTDEVTVIRAFVSVDEQQRLLRWAERQRISGALARNTASDRRSFRRAEELDEVSPVFWAVRDRIIERLALRDFREEPQFRCLLACHDPGGAVHPHRDGAPDGWLHLRCNLMLSMPSEGGRPVVEGNPVEVGERDLWCFYPNLRDHWSEKTVPRDHRFWRFVCSYGFLVPVEQPTPDSPAT